MKPSRKTPRTSYELAAPDDLSVLTAEDGSVLFLSFSLPEPAALDPHAELTPAESNVLHDIMLGLSNKAIAARRQTSPRTVANQVASLFRKLGVSSRAELVTSGALLRGRQLPPA